MSEAWIAAFAALFLGFQTSISPCPLTTNIAAVAYLGRDAESARRTAGAGISYTLGRVLAYTVLAWLLASSLLRSQSVSRFLQVHMQELAGPLLLLTAIVLLDLIPVPAGVGAGLGERFGKRLRGSGLLGAFGLGALLALAFCPVSAVFYFGQLLPLALERQSPLLLPALYGIGTAVPVLAFVIVIAFSADQLGKRFEQAQRLAGWLKIGLSVLLLVIGVYMTLAFTLFPGS